MPASSTRTTSPGRSWKSGVRVPGDLVRDGPAERAVAEADVDVGQVEGVEDEFDLPADQRGVDVVGVGLE